MKVSKSMTAQTSIDFSSLDLNPALLQVIDEIGYKAMTPIQARSIPLLVDGKDLVAKAKTGSGKTAAYALPLLQKLSLPTRTVQGLVLCPTRELSAQVAGEIRKLGRYFKGLQVSILSGGQPLYPQAQTLERGSHIVVGTPGRIMDHLRRGTLDLTYLKTVVLDEADRMLDMGFQEDMETILRSTPKSRQTAFFSATYPNSIEAMSAAFQYHPSYIEVEPDKQSAASIQQQFYKVEHKVQALLWLIKKHQPQSCIVFCNQKVTTKELSQALEKSGVNTSCLHGDLEQRDRDQVMAKFRNHSIRVLIATDLAARGIDVEKLDLVFNFDLPLKPETYVHRIGRTGRAGQKGQAITLVSRREEFKAKLIKEFINSEAPLEILPSLEEMTSELKVHNAIAQEAKMTTLQISGGRKEKLRAGDILGALTGESGGFSATHIGKIETHDHFTYVAVSTNISHVALTKLQDGRIKGRKFNVRLVH